MNAPYQRLKAIALALIVGGWFLGHTWKGLFVYFTDDDLMNMYGAWMMPLHKLILANLTPFTSVYRPVGSALYRVLYFFAGLSPLPFRVIAYVLLLVNVWLLYRVTRLLTESTEVAVLAALIGSYHGRTIDLFTNNGTIYDILCYAFYYLTLIFYVNTRRMYGTVRGLRLLTFCILYTLALNSKEMAVTLPVVLLAYELIYHTRASRGLFKWLKACHAIWVAGLMTIVATKAKTLSSGPFTGNPEYTPHITLHQYVDSTTAYMGDLFFQPWNHTTPQEALAILALVWLIAWFSGNRALRMAAVMITVMPLPINFISGRGFFVMYLPLVGWTIYLATILVVLRDWLWRVVWRRPPLALGTWEPERVGLFLLTAWVLYNVQAHDAGSTFRKDNPTQTSIRELRKSVARVRPSLSKDAKVLLLSDAFPADGWAPLYIIRLYYRDPGIEVDRIKSAPSGVAPLPIDQYNLVLDYRGNRYEGVSKVE